MILAVWFFASAAKTKQYFSEIQVLVDALERPLSPGPKTSILPKVDNSRFFNGGQISGAVHSNSTKIKIFLIVPRHAEYDLKKQENAVLNYIVYDFFYYIVIIFEVYFFLQILFFFVLCFVCNFVIKLLTVFALLK